jgi:hypothetical protein
MQLKPDVTTCPGCGKFVYACDDLIAVRAQPGLAEELPGCQPGLYHRECFEAAPFRAAYLALYEKNLRWTLTDRAADWPVLAADDLFALNLKPRLKEYTLYLFRQGREVPFAGREKLTAFRQLLAQPELGLKRESDALAVRDAGGWALSFRRVVPLEFSFLPRDYARILGHLQAADAELPGREIDLGTVCQKLDVKPLSRDCPLDRARGVVRATEPLAREGGTVVTLAVEWWQRVPLTHGEMERLQAFLREAQAVSIQA